MADNFATKTELNIEAATRAQNDQALDNKFSGKINEINNEITVKDEKITNLEQEVAATQDNIKMSNERIVNLESGFFDEIKRLETENKELNLKLVEKDNELKKLQLEMANENGNRINLPFANVPEFEVDKILTVKEFINTYLKDLVTSRMAVRWPAAEFLIDYIIEIEGLSYNDFMQGKNVLVFVKSSANRKLQGESSFEIKVNYNYNILQQTEFLEHFLQSAIPVSLRNVDEKASPDYNVPNEIINTKPLKLLLNNKKIKNLSFKIFAEMNAGSYWTDFHRSWQYIKEDYAGTGASTIGQGRVINKIKDLSSSTLGYYNYIFKIIEQQLNDSGVKCFIKRKIVKNSRGDNLVHSLGNLTFNVVNSNLSNNDIIITRSRHYYLMLNFEVDFNNLKKLYRGVTLVLTNNLELY